MASSQSKWANKAYKEQDERMENMMKTYMSGFAIDEEAVDAEVPSDDEIAKRSVEDYMTVENKRPVSARRGVNPTLETELIDGEVQ